MSVIYRNLYECPDCGEEWVATASSPRPDACPECGADDIDPHDVIRAN